MNINLSELVKKVPAKGVLHVGANTCQELELYKSLGFGNRLWIEPITNLKFPKEETIIHATISDKESEEIMHVADNNGESSSLLRPLKHLNLYPKINFNWRTSAFTTTLKIILDNFLGQIHDINYLVLDIQGAELKALKGLGTFANHFDVIITEAYIEELYEGCGKVDEITEYLKDYQLVEFAPELDKGWGDAAFIRKDLI